MEDMTSRRSGPTSLKMDPYNGASDGMPHGCPAGRGLGDDAWNTHKLDNILRYFLYLYKNKRHVGVIIVM